MKCPERYRIMQQTVRKPIIDLDNIVKGEYNVLIESQSFENCYEEQCAAWDKENKICRKVGEQMELEEAEEKIEFLIRFLREGPNEEYAEAVEIVLQELKKYQTKAKEG